MLGKKSDRLIPNWEEENDTLIIDVPTEFNFAPNLGYLQREENECMYGIRDGVITRVIVAGSDPTLVQVSSPNSTYLLVRFLAGTRPESIDKRATVVDYVRDWFDLDTNIAPFYEMAKKDPLLKQPIRDLYGLRIVGLPDLFEALCWAILGQQINLKFAYTLKRQFVEKYGDAVEYNGNTYWVFPTYETISLLDPEDMSDIKMTVRKSEYIIGVAQLMANGDLSKRRLQKLDDFKKVEKELIAIRGIGPWTANYVLMRCFHYPMAFPIDDVGLINTIKSLKGLDQKPTKKEILEMTASWKNWEAYATFYLWRVLY